MNRLKFKVVASSSNTNSFGLRGHVLIAHDGQAFEVGQQAYNPCVPILEKGKVIDVPVKNGEPQFYDIGLGEITVTPLPVAPKKVVEEVWA